MMSSTNPLLKFLMGILNFLLPLGFIAAFAFAAIFSVFIFFNPVQEILLEIPLVIFTVLSGTYVARHSAIEARQKAAEKVKLQEMTGAPIEEDDQSAAAAAVPTFMALLKRNALIAVFFVPLVILITGIAYALGTGIVVFSREIAENRTGFSVLIRLLNPLPLFGWLFAVMFAYDRVARFVDQRVLRAAFDLPLDEEGRQKQRMRAALQTGTGSKYNWAHGLWSTFVALIAAIGPLLLIMLIAQILPVSETVKSLFLLVASGGYLLLGIFAFPKLMQRRLEQRVTRDLGQMAVNAPTPEEAAQIRQELEQMKARQRVHEQSAENRAAQRTGFVLLSMLIGVFVLGGTSAVIARAMGADVETGKTVALIVMVGGILLIFGVGSFIVQRLAPKTVKSQMLLEGYEQAGRRGDYPTLLKIVDHAMHELPNWETQIPGAAAYAQMGRLDEAERIARRVLAELSNTHNEDQLAVRKPIIGHVFGLLAEIQWMDGQFTDAETSLRHGLELNGNDYAINNTAAKLYLCHNNPDKASSHLETALKAYRTEGKEPSAYNMALRAWALSLKGEAQQANALMSQAFKRTPAEHKTDLADLYILGGYLARAEGKPKVAKAAFEKAIEHDPDGIYGIVARRELGSVSV